jgi:putative nucleotidyltransferase with HDIG domain
LAKKKKRFNDQNSGDNQLFIKYLMILTAILFICFILPKQARFKFEYEKGKVWTQSDLISPFEFAIQKTPEQLEKDQLEALKTIKPVYRLNPDIVLLALRAFDADFQQSYFAPNISSKQQQADYLFAKNLLMEVYGRGIIQPIKRYQRFESDYNFILLRDQNAEQKNTAEVFDLGSAKNHILKALNNANVANRNTLLKILESHLRVNYSPDERLTKKIEKEARQNISPHAGMVQKGELIIADGDVINAESFQKLESLRIAFEGDPLLRANRQWLFLGQFFIVSLVIALLMFFLDLFRKDIFQDHRKLALILMVICGMLAILSWAIKLNIPSLYYIPYCIVPIIIRILFDTRLALNIHLLVVLIASFLVPNSFEFAFLQITAGMTAIYSIKKLVKREQFLISAILIFVSYVVAYLGILLIKDASFYKIEWTNFIPFAFSVIITLLAYPFIYGFEKLFGITSEITLMELSNTNSPLLRDLAFKAPGTFQHSMQVANLAEAAIYKIGGNALLVRAGALYHDIGKMENPQYFIENQNTGANPHDKLPYEKSAQIIIQHVYRGVEIARRNRIPELLIDFIRTHHGNTRVDYFYQSFLKNSPKKMLDEKVFRYPGPIPFSKETAVLMLADSVEAASRSLKNPDEGSINDLVERIIDYKLDQNQLIDSNITLKDIQVIKQIFKTMLMGIYHVRITYHLEK